MPPRIPMHLLATGDSIERMAQMPIVTTVLAKGQTSFVQRERRRVLHDGAGQL